MTARWCREESVACGRDAARGRLPHVHSHAHTLARSQSQEWNGGVVVISHHSEFTSAICKETWTVAGGKLVITKKEDPLAAGGADMVVEDGEEDGEGEGEGEEVEGDDE
jgi:ABC-type transporter Mla maintaining outer membrane lipid asymmetry ATPase subunit MlaF